MNMLSENTMLNLENKVVIVTGAGKGIGYVTAKRFYELGCRVAVISRNADDLKLLEKEINADPERFYQHAGDVSKPEVVDDFVDNVIKKFGEINVLINNAGIRYRKEYLDIEYADWQMVMNVNLGSTFLMSKKVGQHMISQKSGRIINMASIVGTLGLSELCAYAASKGAIISLTKSLSLEWAQHNINVNAIAPGFCETSYADKFKENQELYDFTIERTPLKKWGQSDDIAKACVYLASDMSDYVTGEIITVDGGWSAW